MTKEMADEISRRLLGGGDYRIHLGDATLEVSLSAVMWDGRKLTEQQKSDLLAAFRYPAPEELPLCLGPAAGADGAENYAWLQHVADILAAHSRLRERSTQTQ